jgi:predicted 3-demethylubiquinone-9 3-methyltransferase (glyoxalase superfamily)
LLTLFPIKPLIPGVGKDFGNDADRAGSYRVVQAASVQVPEAHPANRPKAHQKYRFTISEASFVPVEAASQQRLSSNRNIALQVHCCPTKEPHQFFTRILFIESTRSKVC